MVYMLYAAVMLSQSQNEVDAYWTRLRSWMINHFWLGWQRMVGLRPC